MRLRAGDGGALPGQLDSAPLPLQHHAPGEPLRDQARGAERDEPARHLHRGEHLRAGRRDVEPHHQRRRQRADPGHGAQRTIDRERCAHRGPVERSSGTIQVAPVPAAGSVVYWTTSDGTVLKGFQMGSEAPPQAILTPDQIGTGCIGCHTVAPPTRRLYACSTASNDSTTGDAPSVRRRALGRRAALRGPPSSPPTGAGAARASGAARAVVHAGPLVVGRPPRPLDVQRERCGRDRVDEPRGDVADARDGVGRRRPQRRQEPGAASAAFSHDGRNVVYCRPQTTVNSGTNTQDGLLYVVPDYAGQGAPPPLLERRQRPDVPPVLPRAHSRDDRFVAYNRLP